MDVALDEGNSIRAKCIRIPARQFEPFRRAVDADGAGARRTAQPFNCHGTTSAAKVPKKLARHGTELGERSGTHILLCQLSVVAKGGVWKPRGATRSLRASGGQDFKGEDMEFLASPGPLRRNSGLARFSGTTKIGENG